MFNRNKYGNKLIALPKGNGNGNHKKLERNIDKTSKEIDIQNREIKNQRKRNFPF